MYLKINKIVLSLNSQCCYLKHACPLHQTEGHIDLPLSSVKKINNKTKKSLPTYPPQKWWVGAPQTNIFLMMALHKKCFIPRQKNKKLLEQSICESAALKINSATLVENHHTYG